MEKTAMGNSMKEIQRRSYFNPSQKEGHRSSTEIFAGLKKITVAILKAVKMKR